jgi:hypothetical protein
MASNILKPRKPLFIAKGSTPIWYIRFRYGIRRNNTKEVLSTHMGGYRWTIY